ncbi:uncharacterized protein [Venturia canescens]|uniref:uncharacterized protein n=1 Tax=Venturia canescens TaxID=32260 RepID=UPI001C9C6687|nr:uncharacterized protein LOC122410829 [Venturia canescens]
MEHELVNIELPKNIHKRSTPGNKWANTRIRIRAFGKDINMWLHPRDSLFASVNTPVYYADEDSYAPEGVAYHRVDHAMEGVGRLFENAQYRASFVIGSDAESNEPTITGPVRGDNAVIVIRPVPAHIVEEHLRKRRSANSTEDISLNKARHVAMKFQNDWNDDEWETATPAPTVNADGSTDPPNLVKLNPEDLADYENPSLFHARTSSVDYSKSIYPKVFLHFDYSYFIKFWDYSSRQFDMTRFLEYVLAFWNGVDLSYRHLENPSVRIHIAGIAVARAFWATPYIEFYTPKYVDPQRQGIIRLPIIADLSLNAAEYFFYGVREQIPLNTYDVAVTMTTQKMKKPTLGIAPFGGACKVYHTLKVQEGVALVHDNAGFDGIRRAAHELGHL